MTDETLNPEDNEMLRNLEQLQLTLAGSFNRIRDTFINASGLAKSVNELSAKVNDLAQGLENAREVNARLDDQLASVRRQRDDAEIKNSQLLRVNDNLHISERELRSDLNHAQDVINQHNSEASRILRERDDAVMKQLEAEQSRDEAIAKLDAITKVLHPAQVVKEEPTACAVQEPHPVQASGGLDAIPPRVMSETSKPQPYVGKTFSEVNKETQMAPTWSEWVEGGGAQDDYWN